MHVDRHAAAGRALDILNQCVGTRGKVRADMTQRYGMEIYSHDRTGTLVYITEQSTISGATGK